MARSDELDRHYVGWFKTAAGIQADFDRSPINEDALLARLQERGNGMDGVTVQDLAHVPMADPLTYSQSAEGDHDHWGGVAATDRLARLARLRPGAKVLDVGSGLGGPARYLADRYECIVVGLDMTESRVESARRLTEMVDLGDRVHFDLGNALDLPYEDESFDVVWGQSAWWLIPERELFVAEARRVLRPGGLIAFEDRFLDEEKGRLATDALLFEGAWSLEHYRRVLSENGFQVEAEEDWTHLMFPTLRAAIEQWCDRVEELVQRMGPTRAAYLAAREIQKLAFTAAGIVRLGAVVARLG